MWPNFSVLHTRFKHRPSLGPGSADDSSVAPASSEGDASSTARRHNVTEDPEDEMQAGSSFRQLTPGSRTSTPTEVAGISSSDHENDEEREPKQRKKAKCVTKPTRDGSSSSVSSYVTFMQSLSGMQDDSQRRQFEHEQKLQ